MYFKKIAIAGFNIKLDWIDAHGAHHVLECADRARPALYHAMQNLHGTAALLCEIGDSCQHPGDIIVNAVKYNWKDDIPTATIEATRRMPASGKYWDFETPAVPYAKWGEIPITYEDTFVQRADLTLQSQLALLESEATLYIRGQRAQTDMFVPEAVDTATGEITEKPVTERIADVIKDVDAAPKLTKNQRRNKQIMERNAAKRSQPSA